MNPTETAIIKTLLYYDIFEYPLTSNQLWRFYNGKQVSYRSFAKAINTLIHDKYIEFYQGFFILRRKRTEVLSRLSRQRVSAQKLIIAARFARLLSYIPTVWFVGVTGSLALESARQNDDIDFLIITAPGALWITRLLCVELLSVFGVRRRPGQRSVRDKICLNMFVDATAPVIPKLQQDLFSAHEIVQMKVLFERHRVYQTFLQRNAWVREFLPNTKISLRLRRHYSGWYLLLRPLETWVRHLQLGYMHKRRTSEYISSHLLAFHPQDARVWILKKYRQKLSRYHLR